MNVFNQSFNGGNTELCLPWYRCPSPKYLGIKSWRRPEFSNWIYERETASQLLQNPWNANHVELWMATCRRVLRLVCRDLAREGRRQNVFRNIHQIGFIFHIFCFIFPSEDFEAFVHTNCNTALFWWEVSDDDSLMDPNRISVRDSAGSALKRPQPSRNTSFNSERSTRLKQKQSEIDSWGENVKKRWWRRRKRRLSNMSTEWTVV